MIEYRELLTKAVDALPENNKQTRGEVYERVRAALVAELRAIKPPLEAREITTYRLDLEDCIRRFENQAAE